MDLNLITIVVLAAVLLIGIAIGFTLSRNSSKGNALYDRALEEANDLRERLRETEARLRNKE